MFPKLKSVWTLQTFIVCLALGTSLPVCAQTTGAAGAQTVEVQPVEKEKEAALESVVVTGSRIARKEAEGPAPVTVITGDQFKAEGFTTVYEVMNSLTQAFQAQTPPSWGSTTVNARQLNLRGLGANHSLLLIDGLRVADYPQASQGGTPYNFQNYNNLPAGMIDRIEVLTSGASAIYGSDAIAGVVNVILKHNYNGDNVTIRGGSSTRGGRNLLDFEWTGGKAGENWNVVYEFQHYDRSPLWGRDRPYTESDADAGYGAWNPVDRQYGYQTYPGAWLGTATGSVAPPAGACASFGNEFTSVTNAGGGRYSNGPYCGQRALFENWVLTPGQISNNGYIRGEFRFADNITAYASVGLWQTTGISNTQLPFLCNCLGGYMPNGFYDTSSGQVITGYIRQFTAAEIGGNANTYDREENYDGHVGLKGELLNGRLNWDVTIGRAVYWVNESYEDLRPIPFFNYFFGNQLGVTGATAGAGVPSQCVTTTATAGTPCYTLNTQRFWNPISPQDYASFGANGENDATSWVDQGQFLLTGDLFNLKGGPLGFSAVLEAEKQGFNLYPDTRNNNDPVANPLNSYDGGGGAYYADPFQDYHTGGGNRNRYAAGLEFRAPVLQTVTATLAGRVDKYSDFKFDNTPKTWAAGLEWRPQQQLLIRGSYNTSFHAPDLIDVYEAASTQTVGLYTDPYQCIQAKTYNNCKIINNNTYTLYSGGNHNLQPETGTGYTYGVVWDSPLGIAASVDYSHIVLNNEIQIVSADTVLADEAGCRTGLTTTGAPYTANTVGSTYCQDAIADVTRDANGNVTAVHSGPINVAYTSVSAIDAQLDYHWKWTNVGDFRAHANYTLNLHYLSKNEDTDPLVETNWQNPRTRANISLDWARGPWAATLWVQRIAGVPENGYGACLYNDGTGVSGAPPCPAGSVAAGSYYTSPWITANISASYTLRERLKLTGYVSNILNRVGSIAYYAGNFEFINGGNLRTGAEDYVGREWSLELDYKID